LTGKVARPFSRVLADTRRTAYVALTIATAIAGVAFANLFAMRRSAQWVAHTHEVLTAFERLMEHVKNLQLGRQMYAITGDSTGLTQYLGSGPHIDSDLVALRAVTQDNPNQVARVRCSMRSSSERSGRWSRSPCHGAVG
jgi:CHASE3 domain sensor protein